MNIMQFKTNLDNIKKLTPQVYKDTMKVSVPFFIFHKKLYDIGNELLIDKFSLNQTELDILSSLYYMTDSTFKMSPTELYQVMLFSSGGMTKALKKLEEKGLVLRLENKDDKRSKLVQLTNKGKETTATSLKEIIAFEDKYFSKLNNQEQDLLRNLLLKMIKE